MNKPSNCNGCIACCLHLTTPPFADLGVTEDGEIFMAHGSDEAFDDLRLLRSAPVEARQAFIRALRGDQKPSPCAWLDLENLRCRFYAHRPGVCRRFELGGERCLAHRKNVGVA